MNSPAIERILIPESEIRRRVAEIGRLVSEDYRGRDLVLVGALKGAFVFLADLARAVAIPHEVDFVRASSYGNASSSSGTVRVACDVSLDLKDKHVLLVEDIYDTGCTMATLLERLAAKGPASLEICALLVKNRPREAEVAIRYAGFQIENVFVVGYGLDFAERFRHLPYVAVVSRNSARTA